MRLCLRRGRASPVRPGDRQGFLRSNIERFGFSKLNRSIEQFQEKCGRFSVRNCIKIKR
ncbi:hypothetical protein MPL1032_240035 [Mesorhizobium plurifarium]|uniref:Uncharacterized protein n=1 Tax=Mesorhizobium plurifarium TaxID=69974 RepID=A0A0K2W065_MESPL|nr:hypothetical protein MPL1032_240035 [Mesorhizobium plurifarium]